MTLRQYWRIVSLDFPIIFFINVPFFLIVAGWRLHKQEPFKNIAKYSFSATLISMKHAYTRLLHKTAQYITIHLFLTLASMPILVAWGLPLSRLSLFGNLFFSPVLFLFLLLSSAVFFFEVMHVPHGFIAWLLEKLTFLWKWILPLHGSDTLYGFSKPPLWLLFTLAITPFVLIAHPRMRSSKYRIIGLAVLLILSMMIIQSASRQQSACSKIPCYGGELTLLYQDGKTVLIDPGYIGRRISAPSWVAYTLTPELIAKTGRLTIDHLITLKPGIMTFEAIRTLGETISIRNFYAPYMYGELTGPLRVAWGKLYGVLQQQETKLHRIYEEQPLELVEGTITLSMSSHGKKTYREITYPHVHIRGFIDDEPVNL